MLVFTECPSGGGASTASPGVPEGGDETVHTAAVCAGEEKETPPGPHYEARH